MPFCTHCGNQVVPADRFCAKCGTLQGGAKAAAASDPLKSMTPRTASMLCYIPFVGWIASIVVLASPRFHNNHEVRFHAFQGIYLFVVWLIVDWVMAPIVRHVPSPGPMRGMAGLLQLTVVLAWVFMLIKTSQEQLFRLPILGELAERSVSEQR